MSDLKKLSEKINKTKKKKDIRNHEFDNRNKTNIQYSQAINISIELISGIALGTITGYFLDSWLNTSPVMIILFFVLGTLAGFLNAYKTIKRYGYFK